MKRTKRLVAQPPTPEQLSRLAHATEIARDGVILLTTFAQALPAQLSAWEDAPADFGELTMECVRLGHDLVLFAAWAEKQTLA